MLSEGEKLQLKLILKPPIDRLVQWQTVCDGVTSPVVVAEIRSRLAKWEELQTIPLDRLGLVKAHCVEFDPAGRSQLLHCRQSQIRDDLAILLDWQTKQTFSF
jgi:hypothetical protein